MNIQENISLKQYNSFGIDARAKYFASFKTLDELKELIEHKHSTFNIQHSSLVLGGGSNILFTKDYEGLVLKNEIQGLHIVDENADHVYVKAGAGVGWHEFVLYCLQNNLAGVENLALIPGSVGASPMQNIGAYGVEIKDVFSSLQAYHKFDHMLVNFTNADCDFGYRESVFKNKYKDQFVIESVVFKLNKKPQLNTTYGAIEQELERMNITNVTIQAIAKAVINIRQSKLPDPKVIGNAGSFFKNPQVTKERFTELKNEYPLIVGYDLANGHVKLAAGWMIEQCGPSEGVSWKGYRNGDAGCHAKQALVLVNYGNANGSEIYSLSTEIIKSVEDKFGVPLSREVNIV